jgi:glycosyltransferase involved in cell wall biosynthesis
MNILLANSSCKTGGVSTFLLSLRTELLARGHRCSIFFFEHGEMESLLPSDAEAHFGGLADCLKLVADEAIDVVHANNVDWPTGISAVRRIGAKLVLTAHKVREPAWTYGWHSGNCDAFVTVASWIRAELQPFTDAPIQVVHNGIDTSRFTQAPREPRTPPIVGWIGRGSAPRKRLEFFAAIAPALKQAGVEIWVIDQHGSEPFARLHPEAGRQLLAATDVWRGANFDEMPGIYQAIAASGGCVVSTASMEGLPLALLEAQACGAVVVAADVRGVRECVSPSEGGVLYPADATAATAADVVLRTLTDRASMARRQAQAAAHVRNAFSLRAMTDRYLGIYESPRGHVDTGGRRRHSMLFDWGGYVEERLGVGYAQYEASRLLRTAGRQTLARAAADEGAVTAPSMYLHPRRFAHLVRQHLTRSDGRQAGRARIDNAGSRETCSRGM